MRTPLAVLLVSLLALSLACSSVTVNLPSLSTGPTETYAIHEPLPSGQQAIDLTVAMGAGTLKLGGGAQGLAEGTVRCNIPEWKPTVTWSGDRLTIQQQTPEGYVANSGAAIVNDWDLRLGDVPLQLHLHAGAYKGRIDLSGLRLRGVEVAEGASEAELVVQTPNPEAMDEFVYRTGASKVSLTGLGNANFSHLSFLGGAGDYTLDFSGQLRRPAAVDLKSGVSTVRIIVPAATAATLTVTGGLRSVSPTGEWSGSDILYQTPGTGPRLSITVEMGLGSLVLETR